MSERYIDVAGGRLAVHDFGAGPAIVLLHADIVDSWAWEPLTPFLLDAGYRVVAFDRRYLGGSTTEDVSYSDRYARWTAPSTSPAAPPARRCPLTRPHPNGWSA